MSIPVSAADAYKVMKKLKKIRTDGKLVKEAINEDTRPEAVMKLGIRGMLQVAGKALGTSLTSHLYFTYHKVHLEAGTGAECLEQQRCCAGSFETRDPLRRLVAVAHQTLRLLSIPPEPT